MDFKLVNPINISYLCLQQMVARLTQWQKENWEELLWWEGMNRHKEKCRRNRADTDRAREETDVDSKRWHFIVTDSRRRPCFRTPGFFYSVLGVKNVCYSFSLRNNYVRTRRAHIWLLLCPSVQDCLTFVSWGRVWGWGTAPVLCQHKQQLCVQVVTTAPLREKQQTPFLPA